MIKQKEGCWKQNELLHIKSNHTYIEFMCYPVVFHQSTESSVLQQDVPLLSKLSEKCWENTFFIATKMQPKIDRSSCNLK